MGVSAYRRVGEGGCGGGTHSGISEPRGYADRWDPPSPAAAGLRRDRLYATHGTHGTGAPRDQSPFTFHLSPITFHLSRHRRCLYVRFALLQLGDLPGGGSDLGFS